MIEAIELTKQYNEVTAVEEISFQVAEGETLGLIEISGGGESAPVKMLNSLIEQLPGVFR